MVAREYLYIEIRGERYKITPEGWIIRTDLKDFRPSGGWIFEGVSTRHWHTRIIHTFKEIWNAPTLAVGGYLWDRDHGMLRQWGGMYNGQPPRITAAWKATE